MLFKCYETRKYVDFHMEGIIYDVSTLYNGLVSEITLQLNIDVNISIIEIKYIVSDMCLLVSIHNDVGVRVLLDPKKANLDFFTKYLLCISLKDFEMYNEDSGVVTDRRHSEVSLTQTNIDLYSNNFIRLIGVILDGDVDENSEEDNDVISDHSNLIVAENLVYKNRKILKEVMRHVGLVEKNEFLCIAL